MRDEAYRDFHAKLVPSIDKASIIGVRTPVLRKYSKSIFVDEDFALFLTSLPHKYYEENNIHAYYIQQIRDFDECIKHVLNFLPYIDNWATCDVLRPDCFKNNTDKLYPYVSSWLGDSRPYVVRFGIGMLESYYLDNAFSRQQLYLVSQIKSGEYYVKMMIAWYFATALAKQYAQAITCFEKRVLDKWTHNKAIQKAIESFRVSDEHKVYLRTLRIK